MYTLLYTVVLGRPLGRSEGDKVIFTVYTGSKNMTKTTQPFLNGLPSKPVISQNSVGCSGSVCMFVCLYVSMFKCVYVFFNMCALVSVCVR